MATLNLGDLTFGVGAIPKGLDKSIQKLAQFSKQVDRLANAQARGAKNGAQAFAKQEQAVSKGLRKILQLRQQLKALGAAPEDIARVSVAFRTLTNEMTRGRLTAVQFSRAQNRFNSSLTRTKRAIAGIKVRGATKDIKGLGGVLRNLESASVLAVGPLSGLGARIRAIGSITKRSTIALALMFGAVTGLAVGIGLLIKSAVKSRIEFDRIQGTFLAATGNLIDARKEFEFGASVAQKFGVSLQSTAQQFGKLTAAARGTKLEGEGVRKIFTGILAASSALRLGADATAGALKAVEQIMSKGTVQAEELRGQLGERIPGAFGLAAQAIGVTTRELGEMLKAGEVLAEDLLPKLGDLLIKIFAGEALRAAKSLSGAMENLKTVQFLFNRRLDETLGASDTAVGGLNAITNAIESLTRNLGIIIPAVGAVGAALIFLAGPLVFTGIVKLVGLLKKLTITLIGARAASLALGLGLALGIAAGVAAFVLLRKSITDVTSVQDVLNNKVRTFIAFQETSKGTISEQATLFLQQTQAQINANKIQQQSIADYVSSFTKNNSKIKQFFAIAQGGALKFADALGVGALFKPEERVGFLEAIDEMIRLGKEIEGAQLFIEQLNLILKKSANEADDFSKAFSKAADKIKDLGRDLQRITEEGIAASAGEQSLRAAQFLSKAFKLLEDITEPKELEALLVIIRKLDVEAPNAAKGLAILFDRLDKAKENISDFEKRVGATPDAMRKFTDAIRETNLEIQRLALGPGKALEEFDKAQKITETIDAMREALSKSNLSLDFQNTLLDQLRDRLIVLDEAKKKFENLEKIVDAVRSGIERAFDRIGESITEAFVKGEAAAINFQNVVEAIIGEIFQTILKFTLIDPISKFITGALGDALRGDGEGGGGSTLFSNAEFFGGAKGMVLKKPTLFGAAGGMVVGGEAGDEGLLPLKRTSSGDLGVNASGIGGTVTVNVFAPPGSDVQTQRRSTPGGENIDVIIDKSVARAIRGRGETRGAIEDVFVMAGRTAAR